MRSGHSGEIEMIKKILVPTDGSETSRKAAKYAYSLAALSGGSVTLLSVINRNAFIGKPTIPATETPTHIVESLEDFLRQAAEQDMRELEKLGEQKGIRTKLVIRYGHPVEEIIREAEREKADLIVMGSHGESALTAAFLGSVTSGVIHTNTKIPVLIVRRS
jgi:nucleotide-binding universal stress UspA family protein